MQASTTTAFCAHNEVSHTHSPRLRRGLPLPRPSPPCVCGDRGLALPVRSALPLPCCPVVDLAESRPSKIPTVAHLMSLLTPPRRSPAEIEKPEINQIDMISLSPHTRPQERSDSDHLRRLLYHHCDYHHRDSPRSGLVDGTRHLISIALGLRSLRNQLPLRR